MPTCLAVSTRTCEITIGDMFTQSTLIIPPIRASTQRIAVFTPGPMPSIVMYCRSSRTISRLSSTHLLAPSVLVTRICPSILDKGATVRTDPLSPEHMVHGMDSWRNSVARRLNWMDPLAVPAERLVRPIWLETLQTAEAGVPQRKPGVRVVVLENARWNRVREVRRKRREKLVQLVLPVGVQWWAFVCFIVTNARRGAT
uniref:Uncharacterized protein n=1 Tax=Ixodes ricinus TaxID=34613 RepID=V5HCZ7_IXORI